LSFFTRACRSTASAAARRGYAARPERNEFFLEYQPVIDLTHRELLGVEALSAGITGLAA
jgi:sensor c-di-GMP phosphodiesterase-like protein